jgi:hypothetical protein
MRIVLGTLAVSFKSTRVIPPDVVRQCPELLHLMSTDFTSNIVDGRLIIRPPATHAHPAAFVKIPYDFSEKAFISPGVNSDACTYLVGPFLLQLRGVPVFVFCHCRVSVQCFMRTVRFLFCFQPLCEPCVLSFSDSTARGPPLVNREGVSLPFRVPSVCPLHCH